MDTYTPFQISELTQDKINTKVSVRGKIKEIKKTSGPYLVIVEDKGAQIVGVTYEQPKESISDYVELSGNLQMGYNGLQIRLHTVTLLEEEKIEAEFGDFIIKNEFLNKLRPEFVKAALTIKEAVLKQRPILIKHHNDADGYSGALALEEAISKILPEGSFMKWNLLSRNPSTTPFYDYFDATVDIAQAISKEERFGNAKPILIIVDNGSTESDEIGINLVKAFGFQVVVLDHHIPSDKNKIDVHINPHLVGGDSNLTAGMLCVELAKMINPSFNAYHYACISAIGDRSNIQDYFPLTDMSITDLKKMAICIDFQAKFLRRMEARGLIQEIINLDKEHLNIIFREIEKRLQKQVNLISMNFTKEKYPNNISFLTLDYKKVKIFDDFPSIGTNAGLLINEFGDKNSVVTVYDDGIIVVRSSKNNFDFNEILTKLKQNPKYGIRGGGHKKAGTVMFVAPYTSEILEKIKEFVISLPA